VRRRRGSARATVRAMDERPPEPSPDEPEGDTDLLTVGLVVFFVALILTVVALLVAPTIF